MVTSFTKGYNHCTLFLLGIQLDDQLFVDLFRNIIPLRISKKLAFHAIRIPFQPRKFPDICFGSYIVSDQFDML